MAKIKNKFNYLLAFAISALGISSNSALADEPKQASSEDEAASEASGGLSAGAIAAAVAAAAAIAAVSDSGYGQAVPSMFVAGGTQWGSV